MHAVVLSGSAIALTAAMLPAQASTAGWRVSAEFATRGHVNVILGVDAVSARDAWATGISGNDKKFTFQALLRHWTGTSWHSVTLPARLARKWNGGAPIFTQVAASSARDVWFLSGTQRGGYLHLSGTRWSTGRLPGAGASLGNPLVIAAAKDFGTDNAWAFGAKVNLGSSTSKTVPYAAHFNGRSWSRQVVPGKGAVAAVSVVSPRSIWAVIGPYWATDPGSAQGATTPLVLHWTPASGWRQAAVQPSLPAGASLTSVVALPGGAVWIGGSLKNSASGTTAFAATWSTGAPAWKVARLGGASAGKWGMSEMAPDGRGGAWGVSFASNVKGQPERLWHLAGATWSADKPSFGKHLWILEQLAAVPGTGSVWGVGAVKAGKSEDGLIAIDGPTPR